MKSNDYATSVLERMFPEEQEEGESLSADEALIDAAERVMEALSAGYSPSPSEQDSPVEQRSKEAARRARAEVLAEALRDFFEICDSLPHSEGEHTDEDEESGY